MSILIGFVAGAVVSPVLLYLVGVQVMARSMKKQMGPTAEYQLVFVRRPVRLTKPDPDSVFFVDDGKAAGILIRSTGGGNTMYHRPEHFLRWKVENP